MSRPLMPPPLLVELDMRARRRSRRVVQVARIAFRAGHPGGAAGAGEIAVPGRVGMFLAHPAAAFASRAGGQHPRQIFFIFAFSFELSSASTSASGRWLRVLDPEVAWSGVLDPGCLECSATQAGGALSRQTLRSLTFDID
jgi:hypothetical protein